MKNKIILPLGRGSGKTQKRTEYLEELAKNKVDVTVYTMRNKDAKKLYKPCNVKANEKGECVGACELKNVGICDGIKLSRCKMNNQIDSKAIEEIAIELGKESIICMGNCEERSLSQEDCELIEYATILYNAGYRKVDDGGMVFSKDLWAKMEKRLDDKCDCCIERERKETARAILQELYEEADRYINETVELNTFQIKQLAQKFGVEVE